MRLFAERLRELRRSRGMTQAELARRADVSVTHLSELENADIAPGIDLVDRLARALGAAPAELLPSAPPVEALLCCASKRSGYSPPCWRAGTGRPSSA